MKPVFDDDNAKCPSGQVHAVRQRRATLGIRFTPACDSAFDLSIDGFYSGWKRTKSSVTCKHCLTITRKQLWDSFNEVR